MGDLSEPEYRLDEFRNAAPAAFAPPSPQWFVTTARQRHRQRVAVVAAGVAALAAVGGVAVANADHTRVAPAPPAASATASPSPAVSPSVTASPSASASASSSTSAAPPPPPLDIRTVDLTTATIALPPPPPHWPIPCPSGPVTFRANHAVSWSGGRVWMRRTPTATGDLTGDGRAEAVIYVQCAEKDGGEDGSGSMLVVTVRDDELVGLAYVGPLAEDPVEMRVSGGLLVATIDQRYGDAVQERTYRWNGREFVQVAGPTTFPPLPTAPPDPTTTSPEPVPSAPATAP